MRGQRNLFEDNPFRIDGDPANSGHFGNKININTFSVKKYPCKEMLYSLERPQLYNSNALIEIFPGSIWFWNHIIISVDIIHKLMSYLEFILQGLYDQF